jgi:hypothetical protein
MSLVSLSGKNSFSIEQKFFERKKAELLREATNKFVLIKNEEILGIYDSAQEAYKDGLNKIGNKPMYIKQVLEKEPYPLLMGIL